MIVKPCPRARPKGRKKERVHKPHGPHDFWSGNEHIGEEAILCRCPGYYPWIPLEKELLP